MFFGNGVMAIAAGLLGNYLVEDLHLGPVAPFDAALLVLLIGGVIIWRSWGENYGDSQHAGGLMTQFWQAAAAIQNGRLGVCQP